MLSPLLQSLRQRPWLVGALLFVGTVLLFSRSIGYGFVNYDDSRFVYNNVYVQAGLTGESLSWAFTGESDTWNPLTRLSHLIDGQLFGQNAWGHHLTSILWHATNAVLVFLVLRRFTGAFWRAALCAAFFAWHPLRVESVTWVSERKDVLSGFFFLLTLWSYATYTERRHTGSTEARRPYVFTLLWFVCGLLSKPMLVTMPGVLLLLDVWPLRRTSIPVPSGGVGATSATPAACAAGSAPPPPDPVATSWTALLLEKLPFVAIAAVFSAITMHTQKGAGMFVLELPLLDRLANAPVSVVRYLAKVGWPFDLVVAYPHPGSWPVAVVTGALLLVLALTAAVLWQWRRQPWLAIGWFWFLGTLVPVIGLVQVGFQSIADRYTYLPTLGLAFALVWTLLALPLGRTVKIVFAGCVLLGCGIRTVDQQRHWRDSVALYEHCVASTTNNSDAHGFLGYTLLTLGRHAEAEPHAQAALALAPRNTVALATLAAVRDKQGRTDEASALYHQVLDIKPDDAEAGFALGAILARKGQLESAAQRLESVLTRHPDRLDVLLALAGVEATQGRTDDAARRCTEALARYPDDAALHNNVALLLARIGRLEKALVLAQKAYALAPEEPEVLANYSTLLRQAGRQAEVCELFRQAVAERPEDAALHFAFGLALVSNRDPETALVHFEKAALLGSAPALAHAEIGHILLARNQTADAAARFRQALAADPKLIRALLGLARAAVQLRAYDEASTSLQQAIEFEPQNPESYATWAEILSRQGRFAEAIPQYEKALSLHPSDAGTHAALGYALYFAGRRGDARHAWEEALRLDPAFPKLRERLQSLEP